ncbi:sensor histidine kinase [Actinoplanes oblitus]|uniref:histidine kinase n=1 Tax=Actinoplanes oblitus TaxID=3040509 RepID=A0ABY8WK98_9ACTN|nr:sensor histidine kinase [Actinoplanes oblitus]WIM96943.1 sensor histidine kinase [Actinoplanes oblitus]
MRFHARPQVMDAAIAATIALVVLITSAFPGHLRNGVALALVAAACLPLVWRRRWPVPVLLACTVAAEGYLAWVPVGAGLLVLAAPLLALYTVVEARGQRHPWLVACLVVAAIGAFHTAVRADHWLGPENLALAALGGVAVAAGEAARNRRLYLAEALLRAEERLAAQRLRIARDLHDSVGHHLALINVQAGVAAHLAAGEPAGETFEQIRRGSRDALAELRDAVGLLRRPGEPAAPVEPAVGLAALDDLLAAYRRSGLRIAFVRQDDAPPIPPAADVVAYRIVQESLTNVARHAGPTAVRLTLRHESGTLTVIVENDRPAVDNPVDSPVDRPAHGLLGMRERVAALGGEFHAGPRAIGGFRVAATLPTGLAA